MKTVTSLAIRCHRIMNQSLNISYAAPQAHRIVNVAIHSEYSPGIIFYIFPREEGSLSCLRQTQGVTPMSTTRLYRGYVNWGERTHTLVLQVLRVS
jgi:hypothetical protein